MTLIANDVQVPEYSGYNTKIARESGQQLQPATHTTCYPLVNMNPAEPDTVLSTMHVVKSATGKLVRSIQSSLMTNNCLKLRHR